MFERFTSESRQVLVRAQEAATRHGQGYLGTEHLLLGLLDEGSVVATLHLVGADPDRVRGAMLERAAPSDAAATQRPAFDEPAKRVLELALREAIDLEDRLIRPSHILLGLLREGGGAAAQSLAEAGVSAEELRAFATAKANVTGRTRGYRERVRDIWDFRTGIPPAVASPGGTRISLLAHELAGGGRVTTVHYLRALIAESNGLAARVLQQLGVTEDKVNAVAEELGVDGTSDEGPEERRARQVRIQIGTGREVTIDDEDVARQLHDLASEGDDAVREALRRLTQE